VNKKQQKNFDSFDVALSAAHRAKRSKSFFGAFFSKKELLPSLLSPMPFLCHLRHSPDAKHKIHASDVFRFLLWHVDCQFVTATRCKLRGFIATQNAPGYVLGIHAQSLRIQEAE